MMKYKSFRAACWIAEAAGLLQLNARLQSYGWVLSREDAAEILENRDRILKSHGRVELDLSVTKKLIVGLAASAYVTQEELLSTLNDIYETFHDLKNALSDFTGDDELIAAILICLDEDCGGSSELLLGLGAEKIYDLFNTRESRRASEGEGDGPWITCF